MSEIKIHKALRHPNIVGFEHVFEDDEHVFILLEICRNEILNELLRRRRKVTEFEARVYLVQIGRAVKYLHKNKIIHRDLKLGNLFLSETMEIKLGDFGLAAKLASETERRYTVCGTPNYIAPEVLNQITGHSRPADLWSVGVILYTLLYGEADQALPPSRLPRSS